MEKFQEIIQSGKPVVVDFYADWCGPCKAMAPVIKEVAAETEGRARIIKVDVDRNPVAAAKYDVRAVPTFIIFKNGQPVWRHAGSIDKHSLVKQLLAFA